MDIIFKITAPTPSNPPQVGDSDFLRHYSGANRSMAWDEISAGIRQATEKFIIPYIGEPLYTDLTAKYQAGTTLSAAQNTALRYLQDAAAYYAVYHILPEKNAFVTSMGVTQNTPTEGSGQPTNQWGWKAKRWSALENGDVFLDKLLAHLESRVKANDTYFDLWKNDPSYSGFSSTFFRQTSDMDAYLNMQGSRRAFISLVKYFRQVEEDVVLPLVCSDLFAALKTQALAGTLSTANALLLAKLKRAIAYLGFVEAAPNHRVVISGDGFTFTSRGDGFDDLKNTTNREQSDAILRLSENANSRGRAELEAARQILLKAPDNYPLWRDSPCNEKGGGKSHSIVVSPDRVGGVGVF